jgi:hypothetical protein
MTYWYNVYQRVTITGYQQILHQRITKQEDQKTDTRELTELSSEANQQTGARELPTYLKSEANQQTGARELPTYLKSEANQL